MSREEIQMKISIQWQIDDDFWAGFEAYLQDHKDLYVPESLDENKKIALLNKTSCLPFLVFKKTPLIKFDIKDGEGRTLLIRTRTEVQPYSLLIFKYFLLTSHINQKDILEGPSNFNLLLNSVLFSNPEEIKIRYKTELDKFTNKVGDYNKGAIKYKNYKKALNDLLDIFNTNKSDSNVIILFKNSIVRLIEIVDFKYTKYLNNLNKQLTNIIYDLLRFKIFKEELMGYCEDNNAWHEEAINSIINEGGWKKIANSIVEISLKMPSLVPDLFCFPYIFCRDYFKIYCSLKRAMERPTKDDIKLFWKQFLEECKIYLKWTEMANKNLVNLEYNNEGAELFKKLSHLTYNYSIHSEFPFRDNNKNEGLIKITLQKPFKSSLHPKCTSLEISYAIAS